MIQKCTQCGAWCSAPYQKSPYALGRFIDGLFGTEGGAEFKCQCGNTWMELDSVGLMNTASSKLSYPDTEMSSGTRIPL